MSSTVSAKSLPKIFVDQQLSRSREKRLSSTREREELDPRYTEGLEAKIDAAVPFLIRLREIVDFVAKTPELDSCATRICAALGAPPAGFVSESLLSGTGVLMIDGIDEVPEGAQRSAALNWIESLARTYPDAPMIVTSRPNCFDPGDFEILGAFERASVDDLSDQQRVPFIENWHEARAKTLTADPALAYPELAGELLERLRFSPQIARMARNPLLCAAICALHELRGDRLPEKERDLCYELTMMLLRRDGEGGATVPVLIDKFGPEYVIDEPKRITILSILAQAMVRGGSARLPMEDALAQMPSALAEIDERGLDSEKMLRALSTRSGVLRACATATGPDASVDAVEFMHNRFKEWLASVRFVTLGEQGELARYAEDQVYAETCVFAAAAPDNKISAEKLIWALLDHAGNLAGEKKRTLEIVAYRARLATSGLDPDLQDKLDKLGRRLLPPKTMTEAKALGRAAGDAVVDKLARTPSRSAAISVRCIRCLATIGTPKALAILDGYREDTRKTVLAELIKHFDPADLPGLWQPSGGGLDMSDIPTIVRLPHALPPMIEVLSLEGTQVTDLTPLAGLSRLIGLDLDDTQVTDLTPLAGLRELRTLYFSRTKITDLTPLAGLGGLQTLYFNEMQISDLKPLADLRELRRLLIGGPNIANLSPLSGLSGLQELSLFDTQAFDLMPLSGLSELQKLSLFDTQVTDLKPLSRLSGLQELTLFETQITDLTPLSRLSGLRRLHLGRMPITDLTALVGLSALRELVIDSSARDLASALDGLQHLHIDYQ